MASISVRLPPLQTEFRRFCERKYLLEKETHNKNEDNTLKELNECEDEAIKGNYKL